MTNKSISMKRIFKLAFPALMLFLIASCGGAAKDELGQKKAELEKLKKQQQSVNDDVAKKEAEILKLDPTYGDTKAKLVAVSAIGTDTFTHYINLQGKIDAQNVAMVAPRGQGGVIRSIHVKQGQKVRKGQLIVTLDNELARQQVAAQQANISGLESQVKLLESIYERQQNLWKNNIGTEVQVLQARTNADNAVAQLNAAKAGVRLAQETAGQASVTAEISGTIDVVNARVGEMFSAQSASDPAHGIRIVNTGDLKVLVQVPENYLERVQVGATLRVTLPEANNRVILTKVSVAGRLIDPTTRSFFVEAKLPNDASLRPNQVALVQIQDYSAPTAMTVPVNTLQNDEKGKFVLVAATENGKMVARKKVVEIGELYGDRLEVKGGLAVGDKVITEGFQGLYDGQQITTSSK